MRVVGDPTTNARIFNQRNADELIFLDIMATKEKREPNFEVIKSVTQECFMPLTFGGGISKIEHIDRLFDIGADKVSLNTAIYENPKLLTNAANKYGSQAVVASIDVDNSAGNMQVKTRCGTESLEKSIIDTVKLVEELGAGEILLNSIDRDGTSLGYDLDLVKLVASESRLPVIACGGCGKLSDFKEVINVGANAVCAATIFHYVGESIITAKNYLHSQGHPVRLV